MTVLKLRIFWDFLGFSGIFLKMLEKYTLISTLKNEDLN